jgi:hypothetical protein
MGDWTGPIYGRLGVLETDGDRVCCHVCGRWFHLLSNHVHQAHDLWFEEYQALFGLARGHALAGPSLKATRRRIAETQLAPWRERARQHPVVPPEGRRSLPGKKRRLETMLDPDNQEAWAAARGRVGKTRRERYAAGLWQTRGFVDQRAASEQSQARRRELLKDPAYREQLSRRIIEGKAAREPSVCIVCGTTFQVPRSWLRFGYGKTCSPACHTTWQLQRGRGRDGRPWQEVAERLRALGPAALECLKPVEAEIVRLFYGLEDGTPWTQRAIAQRLGLSIGQVKRTLRGPRVSGLLGAPPRRAEPVTVTVSCAICGTAVVRTPAELRDRVQTTCGPLCRKEFTRRQLVGRAASLEDRRRKGYAAFVEKLADPDFRAQWSAKARKAAINRHRPEADRLRALPPGVFEDLDPRDRELVYAYYGLGGEQPKTLADVARQAGLGQVRTRRVIESAVTSLFDMRSNQV